MKRYLGDFFLLTITSIVETGVELVENDEPLAADNNITTGIKHTYITNVAIEYVQQ